MIKILFVFFSFITFSFSNLFTITDRKGNIVHTAKMKHSENAYLNQKSTEYSLQAIYDELHKAEYLARKAEAARQRAERIAIAQAEAKKIGQTYKISAIDKQKLLEDAKYFKGGKYVWGGTTPEGFDCSGYVQYLYKKHNINLPRTAWAQSKKGTNVEINDLQKGDLLFFGRKATPQKKERVTHVGIYLGDGKFIHTGVDKAKVAIESLFEGTPDFAEKRLQSLLKAKRVIGFVGQLGVETVGETMYKE